MTPLQETQAVVAVFNKLGFATCSYAVLRTEIAALSGTRPEVVDTMIRMGRVHRYGDANSNDCKWVFYGAGPLG